MEVRSKTVGVLLGAGIATAIGLHLAWMFLRFGLGYETMMGFGDMLNLDYESGFGTWFSTLMLAIAATLLWVVASVESRDRATLRRGWLRLALGFAYLSLDEILEIHERLMRPMTALVGNEGIFYHSWIALAVPVLIVLTGVFVPFLLRLTTKLRLRICCAGALYVTGAVIMEGITGYLLSSGVVQKRTPAYVGLVALEESLELIGPAIFVVALLHYLEERHGGVQLQLGARAR